MRRPAQKPAAPLASARLQQRLGASERFFVRVRAFTPINVTRVVALSTPPSPTAIQRALSALAARHPLLRAAVAEGTRPAFAHDSAAPITLTVVERRSEDHFQRVLEQVLNTPLAAQNGRLFAFFYVYTPGAQRAELILAGEHSACDGISMNQLSAELLQLAARGTPVQVKPVLPVLEDMLHSYPMSAQLTGVGSSLLRLARIALSRRRHEQRATPRTTAYAHVSFTRAETEALLARARSEGTSLTGLLMAALLSTLRAQRPELPRLALSVPINLRPRLARPGLSAENLGNYTSAAYLTSDARDGLWDLARTLKAELDREATGERLLASVPLVYRAGGLLVRQNARPLAHAMLSNSGQVPLRADYETFRAVGFYSASSAPMLSADLAVFCNTFDGRLTLNFLFAEEVMSRTTATELGAALQRTLVAQGAKQPGLFTAA